MGLFYNRRVEDDTLVLTVNPLSYATLLAIIAATVLAGPLRLYRTEYYANLVVMILAVWYAIETWPVIKANWTDCRYEKQGTHLLSFSDPLEFWIKK